MRQKSRPLEETRYSVNSSTNLISGGNLALGQYSH